MKKFLQLQKWLSKFFLIKIIFFQQQQQNPQQLKLQLLLLFNCFSEHDDLLNFEIGDGDFADGTLNEDELLLSDEGKNCAKFEIYD